MSIENTTGSAVDMSGWTLNDENGNRYTFPDGYSLGRRSILRVWTQVGVNSANDLFWGRTESVWNPHDCGYLRDAEGALLHQYCY